MEAVPHADGVTIKHTPTVARAIGEMFELNSEAVFASRAIAANAEGDVVRRGLIRIQKVTGAMLEGAEVYWDEDGDPVGLTTGTGAITTNSAVGNFYVGVVKGGEGATSADAQAVVDLNAGASGGSGGGNDLLANVADSANVTNTTTETVFDKSFTIPTTSLKIGTVFKVRAGGRVTGTNSTDTLIIRLKIGTETIVTSATVDVADNDIFLMDADVVIRTLGASGTLSASGVGILGVPATATAFPFSIAEATEDTTSGLLVSVTAKWSVANAGNIVNLDNLVVDVRN